MYVLGGGCFGCLHGGQLLRGWERGTVDLARLTFVDRRYDSTARSRYGDRPVVDFLVCDWIEFLVDRLWSEVGDLERAYIVPAPRAPHLMFEFLDRGLERTRPGCRLERTVPPWRFQLPYEHRDAVGNLFISAAGWVCPPTCIEPRSCPAIRAPRTWHLPELVREVCRGVHLEVFYSSVFAYGVAGIPVTRLHEAKAFWGSDTSLLPERVAVATVSGCHGVLALARVRGPDRRHAGLP